MPRLKLHIGPMRLGEKLIVIYASIYVPHTGSLKKIEIDVLIQNIIRLMRSKELLWFF